MKRIIFSFLCMFVAFQTAISQTMTWNQRYQNYFDKYVNRIGEDARRLATVINRNQITREEIANWVED